MLFQYSMRLDTNQRPENTVFKSAVSLVLAAVPF